MNVLKKLKLRGKMLLYILSASFLIIAFMVGYLAVRTHKIAINGATSFVEAKTNENANKAQLLLEEALNSTRTLAFTFEGIKLSGETKRETATQLMRQILECYPQFLGVWTVWEPNAFDGTDEKYVNTPGHDASGRFIAYWNRGSGSIALEYCVDYLNTDASGDYYNVPAKSGKEYLGEPYSYVLQGKNLMMTSIAVPIHYEGKLVGVVGIDISVETLQKLQTESSLFKTGSSSIISYKGMIIADSNAALIGKTADEFTNSNMSNLRESIVNGKKNTVELYLEQFKDDVICSYSPIVIGNTGTPWTFVTKVPLFEAMTDARRSLIESFIVGMLGLLILSVIIWILSKNFTKHILRGVDFAKKIANGDLTTQIKVEQQDEIGELVTALNDMSTKLKDIVSNIYKNADYISHVSTTLNSNSQELSEGSTEQASATEEVSSSMEEMASNILQNAENAKETAKITTLAYGRIKEGSEAGELSIQSMNEIADKITIIGDIAFQTNILALNAAVESARAGEHGRGFAVVASEVRKLAERSKVAADAINNLSKTGVSVSQDAGVKLKNLIPEIEKTTKLVQEISTASMEQSSGADQINNALQQLNVIVQKNALTSQEMAKSSEELLEMSDELKNNISFFKIN